MKSRSSNKSASSQTIYKDTVLVIEDSPDHQLIIRKAAEHSLPHLKLMLMQTKEEGLLYLNQCEQEGWGWPRLVILDLYTPDREDGWAVLESIRSRPAPISKVPVVVLSSSNASNDIHEAYQRGCSSYLLKPITLEDWMMCFKTMSLYWLETVSLPKGTIPLFS